MNLRLGLHSLIFPLAFVTAILAGCGGAPAGPPSEEAEEVGEVNDGVVRITYTSVTSEKVSLAGQGGSETTVVTFTATNSTGTELSGIPVSFSLTSDIGGVSLLGVTSSTTNDSGVVSTTVKAGNISTTVRVIADVDGTDVLAISEDITIAGGVPIADFFDLSREPNNADTLSTNGTSASVRVDLGDQFGNPTFDGLKVSFHSPEMGIIGEDCTVADGTCGVTWISSGNRPLNRKVTFLATVNGAEAYDDLNKNELYDAGEPFVDIGEPWANLDESYIWMNWADDPSERKRAYIDSNNSIIVRWNNATSSIEYVETVAIDNALPETSGNSLLYNGSFEVADSSRVFLDGSGLPVIGPQTFNGFSFGYVLTISSDDASPELGANGEYLYNGTVPLSWVGTFTNGDHFIDVNKNGVWDAGEDYYPSPGVGNGIWDGPCPEVATGCTESSSVLIGRQATIYLCPSSGAEPQYGCEEERRFDAFSPFFEPGIIPPEEEPTPEPTPSPEP